MARATFNTLNCVAVPRHPDSHLPMPSYERLEGSTPEVTENKSESSEAISDAEQSEDHNTGMIQKSAFQMSVLASKMLDCENCEEGFYEKLTTLKQQNIHHLQELESQMKGGKSNVSSNKEKPLFVLDMPCYCNDATEGSRGLSRHDDLTSFEEEDESLEEQINALFEGVSDQETDEEIELKSKRSRRVQSAPPAKFKPTEVKPFSMTLR